MVKVESGLFNRLSGTLQKSRTTFQTRKSGIVAERKPIPPKEPKGRRECIRWIYRYLCDKWNTLSEQEKEQYSETAEKHNITLFNAYLKEELTPRLWKCKLSKIDGQVLYLAMVEGEGNVAKDFSGLNNNGTIIEATWEKDEKKTYLSFDGINDYAVTGNQLELSTPLTLIVWFNYEVKQDINMIMSNSFGGGDSLGFRFFVNEWQTEDRDLRVESGTGTSASFIATEKGVVEPHKWHFGAVVINGENSSLFLNENKWTGSLLDFTASAQIFIGRHGIYAFHFKGKIALSMIFNRALTDEEIAKIYELTKPYFE